MHILHINFDILYQFASSNVYLGLAIVFFGFMITNIVPLMIFVYPDIFIYIAIFLGKNVIVWYIPYIILIISAFIGESISYFLGYKYGEKILKYNFFQKEKVKERLEKLKNNSTKTLIIGKMIPGIVWVIPVFSGVTKMPPKKFLLINLIMIIYSISVVFFGWLLGLHLAEKIFGKKVWLILGIIIVTYAIGHILWIIIRGKKKK